VFYVTNKVKQGNALRNKLLDVLKNVTEKAGSNDRPVNPSLDHKVNNPSGVEPIGKSDSKVVTFRVGNHIL